MKYHSEEGKEIPEKDENEETYVFIVEIPVGAAAEDQVRRVRCASCQVEFDENSYVANAYLELGLDALCISCDPAAEEREWFGAVTLV